MKSFNDIPQLTRNGRYEITMPWDYIEIWLANKTDNRLTPDTDPLFQRGHVWTEAQQIAYIEFCLRGGTSGRTLHWNCPGWMTTFQGPLVLVDGKQRLEAIRAFMRNDLPVFGKLLAEWEDTPFRNGWCLFNINSLPETAVLQWYLDLNSGGTVHTEEELQKVRDMIQEQK